VVRRQPADERDRHPHGDPLGERWAVLRLVLGHGMVLSVAELDIGLVAGWAPIVRWRPPFLAVPAEMGEPTYWRSRWSREPSSA
jgi:hypothetical protein